MRLDEDQLDTLRRWGDALGQTAGEQSAAAGRAILLLIEEIEQLRVELSDARQRPSHVAPVSMSGEDEVVNREAAPEEPALTLPERLQQALKHDSDDAGSVTTGDGTTSSPQSWIESLRRGK
jgi:hypothetical protein